jgi:two-component system, NarL family, response regulator DevR
VTMAAGADAPAGRGLTSPRARVGPLKTRESAGNTVDSVRSPGPIRILVAGEHRLSTEGLTQLLREDRRVAVVGQATSAAEAIARISALEVDIVLIDLAAPKADWLDGIGRMARPGPPAVRVIVLSANDSDEFLVRAIESGASGYLLKDVDLAALSSAILAVARGEQVLAEGSGRRMLELHKEGGHPLAGLSERQTEILKLVGSGLSSKEIASRLGLREKTVRNQCSRLYARIGVQDRGQAILYAIRSGLVA